MLPVTYKLSPKYLINLTSRNPTLRGEGIGSSVEILRRPLGSGRPQQISKQLPALTGIIEHTDSSWA